LIATEVLELKREFFLSVNGCLNLSENYNSSTLSSVPSKHYFFSQDVESASGAEKLKALVKQEGFALIEYDETYNIDSVLDHVKEFLGAQAIGAGQFNRRYIQISPQRHSVKKYLANTCLTQQLHTDEAQLPRTRRYMTLFCQSQADVGGVSTLVQFSNIAKKIRSELVRYEDLLCAEDALEVFGSGGLVKRPLIMKFAQEDYGVVFPTMLKELRACEPVMKVYLKIFKLAHMVSNQIRLKLKPGQLLVVDNFKVLHGRTAFPEGKERRLYRTGYDSNVF
jgi:hypothetical protein